MLGTAVCIGSVGWFLTARHVVDQFVEKYGTRLDGSTGLFVLCETDERTVGGANDFLGAPLPVEYPASWSSPGHDREPLGSRLRGTLSDRPSACCTSPPEMPTATQLRCHTDRCSSPSEGRVLALGYE